MLHLNQKLVLTAALAVAACGAAPAKAGVVISGTRVVFPAAEREVSVRLANTGDAPALVQSWIDDGDAKGTPETMGHVPFVIRPPVARVDPGSGQVLRIAHTGQAMPQDRESVYFLNVLDVPAAARASAGDGVLHLVVRSRLKVFYRPKGLTAVGAAKAPSQLRWSVARDHEGWALKADNPTPYHVSVDAIVGVNNIGAEMVRPRATRTYRLSQAEYSSLGSTVTFKIRTDHGAQVSVNAPLARN
ncbi:TPA: molecular chaperone [Stenotrophomonas maltophilia]